MSKGWIAFIVWTGVVIAITSGIVIGTLKPRKFDGDTVSLTASNGWFLDVKTEESVRIKAADSEYFRISHKDTQLYGVPQPPPLDYKGEDYFHLESQMKGGTWEVLDGSSVSIKLTGKAFGVIVAPTELTTARTIINTSFLAFLTWGVVSLLGFCATHE